MALQLWCLLLELLTFDVWLDKFNRCHSKPYLWSCAYKLFRTNFIFTLTIEQFDIAINSLKSWVWISPNSTNWAKLSDYWGSSNTSPQKYFTGITSNFLHVCSGTWRALLICTRGSSLVIDKLSLVVRGSMWGGLQRDWLKHKSVRLYNTLGQGFSYYCHQFIPKNLRISKWSEGGKQGSKHLTLYIAMTH